MLEFEFPSGIVLALIKEGASNRATYLYNDAGERTRITYGNSSYAEYLYNGAGNLTLLSNRESDAMLISGFGYLVDDVGNRTKMEIDGTAYTSADVAYLYDDAYQLTSEVRTGGDSYTQTFVYDSSGNRTKKTLGGVDTTYLYNTGDQLTSETTAGTTTVYEYDANGALTKSDDSTTVNVYTYDYDGYLAAFDTTGTENDATYTYDADKRRIGKTVDSTTIKYFLDGPNVIADFDGDDVLLATYVTPGLDANLSQERGGSTYYYMADGLGSIRNLVDANEDTQNTYDYYAFGKELGQWSENVTNRYTYTAREYDTESAQYYYRARYYSGSGRFNRRDPVAPYGYVYVSSAPTATVDSSGLWGEDVHWDLTLTLAREAGILCARDVADGALRPDLDRRQLGTADLIQGIGFATKVAQNPPIAILGTYWIYKRMALIAEWHFPVDAGHIVVPGNSIASKKVEKGIRDCNFKLFTEGLHVLQDSWSHQGLPYTRRLTRLVPGIGHNRGGYFDDAGNWVSTTGTFSAAAGPTRHSADNVRFWPADVRATGLATYGYLVDFADTCACSCPGGAPTRLGASASETEISDLLLRLYPGDNVE